jgi:hypothetical protein
MSAAHPAWSFEVAPDIGHVPMLEDPEWTTGAITRWLRGGGAGAVAAGSDATTGEPGFLLS